MTSWKWTLNGTAPIHSVGACRISRGTAPPDPRPANRPTGSSPHKRETETDAPELPAWRAPRHLRLHPRRRLLHRQQRPGRLSVRWWPGAALRPRLSAPSAPARRPGRACSAACPQPAAVGKARPARRRRHGRLQSGDTGRGTYLGTRRSGRVRRLRARHRRRARTAPGRPSARPARAVRGPARRRRSRHRAGLGPYRPGGHLLVGGRADRRGGLRRTGHTGAATARPQAANRDRMRHRGHRVHRRRPGPRRSGLRADARPGRDPGAAVAGGDCHRRRLRHLVHGRAAHRRRARHALHGADPRRRRPHRAPGGHRDVRFGPGGGRCAGRSGRGARLGGVREAVSGCRPG